MEVDELVVVADHSSTEGSRNVLAGAAASLTGKSPRLIDARYFMPGGGGRVYQVDGAARLEVPAENLVCAPSAVVLYEIAPEMRIGLVPFQEQLRRFGVRSLGTDARAWHIATDKHLTVERFAAAGIGQMESVSSRDVGADGMDAAFERLGGDVWARPTTGTCGDDVFHVTSRRQFKKVAKYYSGCAQDWLISRDARNFDAEGRRHQYRVVVLHGRVLRVNEHVQDNPDLPCNVARGAVSTPIPLEEVDSAVTELAVRATEALGLPFAGVDLAPESGGVVFEVNVHPRISPKATMDVAIPYLAAHLARPGAPAELAPEFVC
ncbi:alpha-L-glutamate ligase [Nocardia panacis]|uniref:Alpha-L-glutamate ligase n=1 Tax=Nocardia panacis TaxID=2340916 RepID=A0A3A4JW79_9NOCA|nr:alpha-L-glutamate ligase [Nocardia panacis]RJO68172.1 alpha-L-glutamate ligase [Nocardia panacis]